MDARKNSKPGKRPRDPNPTLSDDKNAKKKSKAKNKGGRSRADSSDPSRPHHHHHHHHQPSTSTADGRIMTQIMSTFSKLEQSRFNAFSQSVLPTSAVEEWLGAYVSQRILGGADLQHPLPLADLCVPNQDQDIVMVVASLAKIYAQRLVATACKLQKKSAAPATTKTATPLQSSDILRAHHLRKAQGLDPGLFLQPQEAIQWSHSSVADQDARLAALAAEEEYDNQRIASQQQDEDDDDDMQVEEVASSPAGSPMQVELEK